MLLTQVLSYGKGVIMFLYEYGDNIDNKRYYYEVFIEDPFTNGIRVEVVLRAIKPYSTLTFNIEQEDVIKILDKKIEKIVEKHYKAHIDYKGEADPDLIKE